MNCSIGLLAFIFFVKWAKVESKENEGGDSSVQSAINATKLPLHSNFSYFDEIKPYTEPAESSQSKNMSAADVTHSQPAVKIELEGSILLNPAENMASEKRKSSSSNDQQEKKQDIQNEGNISLGGVKETNNKTITATQTKKISKIKAKNYLHGISSNSSISFLDESESEEFLSEENENSKNFEKPNGFASFLNMIGDWIEITTSTVGDVIDDIAHSSQHKVTDTISTVARDIIEGIKDAAHVIIH